MYRTWLGVSLVFVIARMWRAWTGSWDADAYAAHLTRTALEQPSEAPGNLATYLLRRADGDRTEFTLLSFWKSMDAVRAMAGEDVERVAPDPADARFLVDFDPVIIHYDVVES